jgi:hypothetical protein
VEESGSKRAAVVTGGKAAIDPKAPKAQTEKSCKEWECFDGYACGPCPGNELPEDD